MGDRICSIDTCERPVRVRGWCNAHYCLWRVHGDPNPPGMRYRPPGMDPIAWFWAGFQRAGSGCLEWQRGKSTDGYGTCSADLGDGSSRCHRVAWVLTNGAIPAGLGVLHRCDNRSCGDPEHLFLGTQADNIRDMLQKGRNTPLRGAANPSAKLTRDQVLEIRALIEGGMTNLAIAALYGVCDSSVSNIRTGHTWRDLT